MAKRFGLQSHNFSGDLFALFTGIEILFASELFQDNQNE